MVTITNPANNMRLHGSNLVAADAVGDCRWQLTRLECGEAIADVPNGCAVTVLRQDSDMSQ
jgi:hypothetical protein